jgi:hypothetical protein
MRCSQHPLPALVATVSVCGLSYAFTGDPFNKPFIETVVFVGLGVSYIYVAVLFAWCLLSDRQDERAS